MHANTGFKQCMDKILSDEQLKKVNPEWKSVPFEAKVMAVRRRGSRACLYSTNARSPEEVKEFFKNPDAFALKHPQREVGCMFI